MHRFNFLFYDCVHCFSLWVASVQYHVLLIGRLHDNCNWKKNLLELISFDSVFEMSTWKWNKPCFAIANATVHISLFHCISWEWKTVHVKLILPTTWKIFDEMSLSIPICYWKKKWNLLVELFNCLVHWEKYSFRCYLYKNKELLFQWKDLIYTKHLSIYFSIYLFSTSNF